MTARWLSVGAAVVAVLAQILYPLVQGSARDGVTVVVVAALAVACLAHAAAARGTVWMLALIPVTAGIGLLAEIIGSGTGYPFGSYDYAQGRIGPSIAGVPVIVPLAWTAGIYPVWRAASAVATRNSVVSVPLRASLTIVGVVGWDFYLDPQMVADGQWIWQSPHARVPGLEIPYTNYLGWLLVATIMVIAIELLDRWEPVAQRPVSDAVVLGLFVWTWLGSSLAHAVFLPEQSWSALYGLLVMGVVGVPLLVTLRARRTRVGAVGR